MIKLTLKIACSFWVASPAIFLILRLMGFYNFPLDSLIFAGLGLICLAVLFLTYRTSIWE